VCLTNHALDQFLVEILKVTKNLTRIGGQSKCDELADYNLRKKKNFSRNSSSLFHELCDAMTMQRDKMKILQAKVEAIKSHDSIVSMESLESVIDPGTLAQLRGKYLKWLSGANVGADNYHNKKMDFNKVISIVTLKRNIEDMTNNEIHELQKAYEAYKIDQYQYQFFEEQIKMTHDFKFNAVVNLENFLQIRESLGENGDLLVLERKNPWKLNMVQRWQLYTHWVIQLKDTWQAEIHHYENKLFGLRERLEELRFHDDLHVLQNSEVVGLTTNGAARLHKLLKLLKCQIGKNIIEFGSVLGYIDFCFI
jgi:hypothetical protein